jgi:hypothetical protein
MGQRLVTVGKIGHWGENPNKNHDIAVLLIVLSVSF